MALTLCEEMGQIGPLHHEVHALKDGQFCTPRCTPGVHIAKWVENTRLNQLERVAPAQGSPTRNLISQRSPIEVMCPCEERPPHHKPLLDLKNHEILSKQYAATETLEKYCTQTLPTRTSNKRTLETQKRHKKFYRTNGQKHHSRSLLPLCGPDSHRRTPNADTDPLPNKRQKGFTS